MLIFAMTRTGIGFVCTITLLLSFHFVTPLLDHNEDIGDYEEKTIHGYNGDNQFLEKILNDSKNIESIILKEAKENVNFVRIKRSVTKWQPRTKSPPTRRKVNVIGKLTTNKFGRITMKPKITSKMVSKKVTSVRPRKSTKKSKIEPGKKTTRKSMRTRRTRRGKRTTRRTRRRKRTTRRTRRRKRTTRRTRRKKKVTRKASQKPQRKSTKNPNLRRERKISNEPKKRRRTNKSQRRKQRRRSKISRRREQRRRKYRRRQREEMNGQERKRGKKSSKDRRRRRKITRNPKSKTKAMTKRPKGYSKQNHTPKSKSHHSKSPVTRRSARHGGRTERPKLSVGRTSMKSGQNNHHGDRARGSRTKHVVKSTRSPWDRRQDQTSKESHRKKVRSSKHGFYI